MNNWEKTKYIKRRENISSKKDGINEKYWINIFTNLRKIAFLAQYLDAENACNICKWQTCVLSFFLDSRKKNQQEIQLCCHSKWKRFHRKYLRCMNVNKKIIITTFAVNWKRIENFLLKRRCKNVLVHCCADRMLRHYNFRSFHSFLLLSLSLSLGLTLPSVLLFSREYDFGLGFFLNSHCFVCCILQWICSLSAGMIFLPPKIISWRPYDFDMCSAPMCIIWGFVYLS